MFNNNYISFQNQILDQEKTIQKYSKIPDYFSVLSKKEVEHFLILQKKIQDLTPELVRINFAIILYLKQNNNFQEPYKMYYEKALKDLEDRITLTFETASMVAENIRISNTIKKRPPYLIFKIKQLFRKLWKM